MTNAKQAHRLSLPACALGLAMLALGGSAQALSLTEAYDAALKSDPTYKMHFFENKAAKESRIIGRSNLLPTVSASYNFSHNNADLMQPSMFGGVQQTYPKYVSRSANVQFRQSLFNLDAWFRYRQGVINTNESDARFKARTAELAVRVLAAYTDALFADDQIGLVTAQRDMYIEQMKVQQRMLEKGEGTRTDVLEVQARLDLAEAQVLEAQDNRRAARMALENIVGKPVEQIDPLGPNFRIGEEKPAPFETWRDLTLTNNEDIKAARLTIDSARQELNKARAAHAPRLDFVATYGRSLSENISTLNQDAVNRTLGVQLNVPLYQGGQVNALGRQASAGVGRAEANLEQKTNEILLEVRKSHNLVLSSAAKIAALVKATDSGKLLIKATKQSIKGGVRINLDLLNAEQQLASSRRDLAQARYSYLLGTLKLRSLAGTLNADDLRAVTAYFR